MIRIAYCDENEEQLKILSGLLEKYSARNGGEYEFTGFSGGRQLLDTVKRSGNFDIYIINTVNPELNGAEAASSLRMMKDNSKLILLTSSLDFTADANNMSAFYYMVKPILPEKLFRVLDIAAAEIGNSTASIAVRTPHGSISIAPDEIMYAALEERASVYYLRDGRSARSLILRGSFRDSASQLLKLPNFMLCGASLVLNMKYLDAVDCEKIILTNGDVLYPSKAGCYALKKALKEYYGT